MRQYKIILMLLVAALLFTISCSDQPTKPKEKDRVSLTLEDVAIHEVWIKVTVDTTLIGNAIQIFKDDKLAGFIERNKMTRKDTILWTSYYPTEPSTSYQYQAVVVNEEFEELAKSNINAYLQRH
jgi:AAA15 family ATPase/GTPase